MLRAVIESPDHAARVRGAVRVRGWVLRDDGSSPDTVELWLDGQPFGTVAVDQERPDVAEAEGFPRSSQRCGFAALVGRERPGQLQVVIRAPETGDEPLDVRWCFLAEPRARITLQTPQPGAASAGLLLVRGVVEALPGELVTGVQASAGGDTVLLAQDAPGPDGTIGFEGGVPAVPGAALDVAARLGDGEPYGVRVPLGVAEAPAGVEVTGAWSDTEGGVVVEGLVTGGRIADPEVLVPAGASRPLGAEVVLTRDGRPVASALADRARPDAARDRPEALAAVRCGFRLVAPAGSGSLEVVCGEARAAVPAATGPAPTTVQATSAAVVRETASTGTVVVPAYAKGDLLRQCLEALGSTLPAEGWSIVAVDDASPHDTWEVLEAAAARDERVRPIRNETNLGFVRSVNAGAREATGEVLVHVNDDLVVAPGWLDALLDVLAEPRAGIAGGKLVHPDGRLQEAGAVVFSDGGIWNAGRGYRPDDPLFDHVRDVDYCSFALAALRLGLWRELGGFDERYAPAYYDDVDLCFAARAAGRRVTFQPRAVGIHHEGASLDPDSALEAPPNQDVFVAKWGDALRGQPEHPLLLDDVTVRRLVAGPRRSVLVLAREWPDPAFARRLADEGLAVTALALAPTADRRTSLGRAGVAAYAGPAVAGARGEHVAHLAALVRSLAPARTLVDARGRDELAIVRAASPATDVDDLPTGAPRP